MSVDDFVIIQKGGVLEDSVSLPSPAFHCVSSPRVDVLGIRRKILVSAAKSEKSDLYCPACSTNLPYVSMTSNVPFPLMDNKDIPFGTPVQYCTLCETYFKRKNETVVEDGLLKC